jgi:ATP-binding cassette, subfamily B, bacterial HlyB/CyaB
VVTLLLDFPFLIVFLAIMFWYSWQLALISVVCLTVISLLSFFITPIIRAQLNHQFMLGARNQAFLTEYVSGRLSQPVMRLVGLCKSSNKPILQLND